MSGTRLNYESTTEDDEETESMEPAGMTQNMMYLNQRLRTMLKEEDEPQLAAGGSSETTGGALGGGSSTTAGTSVDSRMRRQIRQLEGLEDRFQMATDEDSSEVTPGLGGSSSVRRVYEFIDLEGSTSTQATPRGKGPAQPYWVEPPLPARPPEKDVSGFEGRTNQLDGFVDPYGTFWLLWSLLMAVASMYELVMVPILVGYDEAVGNGGVWFVDYLVNAMFLLDIILLFHVARPSCRSPSWLLTDRVGNQVTYAWGWFPWDFIAWFPMDIIIWGAYTRQQRHLTRLLKVLHVFRLYRALHVLWARLRLGAAAAWAAANRNVERLVGVALALFLLVHWAGCLWIRHGKVAGFGSTPFLPPASLAGANFGAQYLHSIHWAFYSVISPSAVAHRPQEVGEYFFSFVLGIAFLLTVVVIIAELANVIRAADSHAASVEAPPLSATAAADSSAPADPELAQWTQAMLAGEDLCKGASPTVVRSLAARCKVQKVPQGAAIIREGTHPTPSLWLLRQGVVEQSKSGVRRFYRGPNWSFNQQPLLNLDVVAEYSIHAASECTLLVLHRADVLAVGTMFPEFLDLLVDKSP